VFAFGDAGYYGAATGLSPTSPVVGLAATPDGRGYWEVNSAGAVFAFGDATFGGNAPVGQAVVAITSAGPGYRLASSDGGVDAFGGADFLGASGGQSLNKPIIAMGGSSGGYVTVAADGGVFAFGGADYEGSLGGSTVYSPPPPPATTLDDGITPYQRAAWDRVNICEEGGRWNVEGSEFAGGLGFSRANWATFNTFGYPADAAQATPDQQIRVAVAFATAYWGNPNAAPDQNGCNGGY
jgi:hypothetical protein